MLIIISLSLKKYNSFLIFCFCRWHGEFRNCSEMFKPTKTDDGFCCSFNTVSLSEGFAKSPTIKQDSADSEDDFDYDDDYEDEEFIDYGDEITDSIEETSEAGNQTDGPQSSTEYVEDWSVINKLAPVVSVRAVDRQQSYWSLKMSLSLKRNFPPVAKLSPAQSNSNSVGWAEIALI